MTVDAASSLDAFFAAAIAMEEEAAQRYEEFADAMDMHNNAEVASMFRRLAAVEARQYDEAAGLLKRVADGSRDPELRLVAQTRLARVLLVHRHCPFLPENASGQSDAGRDGVWGPGSRRALRRFQTLRCSATEPGTTPAG